MSLYLPERKKNIPQNVVAAHTGNIPHIEKFFCTPVQSQIEPFGSVRAINRHGMVIANFGWRSTGTSEHPQGYFIYRFVFQC